MDPGHEFTANYVVTGTGGTWFVTARDGEPLEVTQEDRQAIGTATVSFDSYQRMASGQISPSIAMQNQLPRSTARSTRSRCSAAGSRARRARTTPR